MQLTQWQLRHLAQQPSATTEGAAAEGTAAEGVAAAGAAAEQICAPDSRDCSIQQMAAFALVHRVFEQNWGTVSEHEERVYNSRDGTAGSYSWGMKQLLVESLAVSSYNCCLSSEVERHQTTKLAAWETGEAACQQAMQQLQQAKDAQRNNPLSACTPEQALSQYHPSAALEFKQQMQGIVEEAQQELARRHTPLCYRGTQTTQVSIASWHERASRTVDIAQELEQAATESFELMEAVLHSQSWDHRLVTKLHDGKLREMELEPVPSNNLNWGDHERAGPILMGPD
jgi:hypothetical protein